MKQVYLGDALLPHLLSYKRKGKKVTRVSTRRLSEVVGFTVGDTRFRSAQTSCPVLRWKDGDVTREVTEVLGEVKGRLSIPPGEEAPSLASLGRYVLRSFKHWVCDKDTARPCPRIQLQEEARIGGRIQAIERAGVFGTVAMYDLPSAYVREASGLLPFGEAYHVSSERPLASGFLRLSLIDCEVGTFYGLERVPAFLGPLPQKEEGKLYFPTSGTLQGVFWESEIRPLEAAGFIRNVRRYRSLDVVAGYPLQAWMERILESRAKASGYIADAIKYVGNSAVGNLASRPYAEKTVFSKTPVEGGHCVCPFVGMYVIPSEKRQTPSYACINAWSYITSRTRSRLFLGLATAVASGWKPLACHTDGFICGNVMEKETPDITGFSLKNVWYLSGMRWAAKCGGGWKLEDQKKSLLDARQAWGGDGGEAEVDGLLEDL